MKKGIFGKPIGWFLFAEVIKTLSCLPGKTSLLSELLYTACGRSIVGVVDKKIAAVLLVKSSLTDETFTEIIIVKKPYNKIELRITVVVNNERIAYHKIKAKALFQNFHGLLKWR